VVSVLKSVESGRKESQVNLLGNIIESPDTEGVQGKKGLQGRLGGCDTQLCGKMRRRPKQGHRRKGSVGEGKWQQEQK
jgi:hypothetical protein